MSDISWKNDKVKLSELKPWERNPRYSTEVQAERITDSHRVFGQAETIAIDAEGNLLNGHQRLSAWLAEYGADFEVDVRRANRIFDEAEKQAFTATLHAGATGNWDFDALANWGWDNEELASFGFDDGLIKEWHDNAFSLEGMRGSENGNEPGKDTPPQEDKAAELQKKWGTEAGQLWQLGEHRLICGDCTDPAVVERVMGGEKVVLCHADPPYGMGKENEGIANDNLYREKLDAFQMKWWGVGRQWIEDNGSVYIWGNAEDLWRLWYCGGLKDSERLTFRNCIAWDKYTGNVKPTMIEMMRSYVVYREDCLFFMLGEQGFNNNADNYWEGWDPIRAYLKSQADLIGWDTKDIQRICGVGMYSHWFTESQWTFITKEHYTTLQAAAKGDAFKREYDDLKREYDDLKLEFYSTRAYFDNTHDNMTDVWNFGRVQGEERWEHATPKPVVMIERIVKSSSPSGAIVYSPFLGSGTDLIACENLGRRARAAEIDPGYIAVSLQRWTDHTGQTPVLVK